MKHCSDLQSFSMFLSIISSAATKDSPSSKTMSCVRVLLSAFSLSRIRR